MRAFRRISSLGFVVLLPFMVSCSDRQPVSVSDPTPQFAKPGSDPITVDFTVPAEGMQGQRLWVKVYGNGFEKGFQVLIERDGSELITHETNFKNPNELEADIEIPLDAQLADYDVVAYKGGKRGIGIERFKVKERGDQVAGFILETQSAVTEDLAFNLSVTAVRKDGSNEVRSYNGNVYLSTDRGTITPNSVRLRKGVGSVVATLSEPGPQTVTATSRDDAGDWAVDVAPTFFVDGKIVYCSDRGGGSDLWVLEGDQAPRQLTYHQNQKECNVNYPAVVWSPDGSRVAFWSMVTGENHVWVANADGSGEIQISGTKGSVHPSWSPGGSMLTYIVGFENEAEVYVAQSDGSGPEIQLTSNIYRDNFPFWSPDGSQIIWSFDPAWAISDDIGIGVITLEFEPGHEGDLDYLTGWVEEHFTDFGYVQPRWSSASNQVAVWGRTQEWVCGDFFVTDPGTMNPQQITWDRFCYDRPGTPSHRWDPSGEMLAVTGYFNQPDYPFGGVDFDENSSQIYLAPRDGSGATALTDAPGNNRWGEWLPSSDGRTFIVFQSTRDGAGGLLAIDVANGIETTLTDVLGNEGKPVVWVPSVPAG